MFSMRPQQPPLDESMRSIRGEQSSRSNWATDNRNNLRAVSRHRDESLDPVFSARIERRSIDTDKPSSNSFADEGSSGSNKLCCGKTGDSLDKCKKFFCVGVILFLILDALLLGIFLSPIRPGKASSSASSIVGINPGANESGSDDNIFDNSPRPPNDPPTIPNDQPTTPDNPPENPIDDPPTIPDEPQGNKPVTSITQTQIGRFELLDTVPHDENAFTQGLEVLSREKIELMKAISLDDPLPTAQSSTFLSSYTLESTGLYGKSTLRIVELATGKIVVEFYLNEDYFAEGCTYFYIPPNDIDKAEKVRIVQLTWKSGNGFVYDLRMPTDTDPEWSLTPMGNFFYSEGLTSDGDGWGIVYHPLRDQFIITDGSPYLYFWKLTERISFEFINENDYITTFEFDLVEKVKVVQNRDAATSWGNWTAVRKLNELEWDPYSFGGNTILANVWKTNEIVRIWVGNPGGTSDFPDAHIGRASHVYDVSDLETLADPSLRASVLNGIAFVYESSSTATAYNGKSSANEFWVTGKYWAKMYRIRFLDDQLMI